VFCGIIVDYSGSMPGNMVPDILGKISEHGCLDILCSYACGTIVPGRGLMEGSPGSVVGELLEALDKQKPGGSSIIIEQTSALLGRLSQRLRQQIEETGEEERCLLLMLTDTLQEIPAEARPLSLECSSLHIVLIVFKGSPTPIHSTEEFIEGLGKLLWRYTENPAILTSGIRRVVEGVFKEPNSIHEHSVEKLRITAAASELLANMLDPCLLFPKQG